MHRNMRLGLLGLVYMQMVGCCPEEPTCEEMSATLDRFDFERVRYAVRVSHDVTDLNKGLATEQLLEVRYGVNGWRVEFVRFKELFYTYMILTNDERGLQEVVLSGTTTFNQFVVDALTDLVEVPELGMRLHRGWNEGVRVGRETIEGRLNRDYQLSLIGFSLGAAGAAIAGLYAQVDGFDVREIIAVGMPCVTDEAGRLLFDELPLTRVIAANDNVGWWPPAPYVGVGDTIILLDGPFVTLVADDDPSVDFERVSGADTSDLSLVDHLTYRLRAASKADVPLCDVPFETRQSYILQIDRPCP